MQLNIGKIRGVQQCSSRHGIFARLALDHRQDPRRVLNPQSSGSVPDSALTDFKLEVTAALADESTAGLLDPECSPVKADAAGIIPKNAGLVIVYDQ
jgi:tagatose-1,6-bisphosphate aldolase